MEFRLKNLLLILSFFFISCKEEEDLLAPKFITDRIGQVDLVSEAGIDYQYQIYFDLSSGKEKGRHRRDAWDLGFSTDPNNPNIFCNPALIMAVASTASNNFSQTFNPNDYDFNHERVERMWRKSWIGDDLQAGLDGPSQVYLLDLGLDLNSRPRGYRKLQILECSDGNYHLQVAQLNGAGLQDFWINRISGPNNLYLNLARVDSVLQLEPESETWDLFFSRYMELLWDGEDSIEYSVSGVLLNPSGSEAYLDTVSKIDYARISATDVMEQLYTQKTDAIGYNWKYFSLDEGAFRLQPNWVYFIRDKSQQEYRFRFRGFYNAEGAKGAISFEYLPL